LYNVQHLINHSKLYFMIMYGKHNNEEKAKEVKKLEENIANLNSVIKVTIAAISRLNSSLGRNDDDPIFYQEYRELQDRLGQQQRDLHALQDALEVTKNEIESNIQEVSPQVRVPNKQDKPVNIKLLLPNGTSKVFGYPGKTLKEVVMSCSRLKSLKNNHFSLYFCGSQKELDLNADSGDYGGQELVLRTKDITYKESTRILKARHKFVRRTYLTMSMSQCDNCGKRLLQGFTCKMCGYILHQKCIQEVEDYCITQQQISELEKIIGPTRSSPDENSSLWNDAEGVPPKPYPRKRAISQPTLLLQGIQTPLSPTDNTNTEHVDGNVNELASTSVILRDSPTQTNDGQRDSNADWEIPEEEFKWGEKIGSGSYGIVYRCGWHGIVAVKVLNVTDPTPSQLQEFKNEVAVLR